MDILRLVNDYNIPYVTEGPNSAPGWIEFKCVWCDDPSEHLGWNLEDEYFRCWRSGWHPTIPTFARLLNVDESLVPTILKNYGQLTFTPPKTPRVQKVTDVLQLPSGTGPLLPHHKQYLINRRFDPKLLERQWGLMSTGPVSSLGTGENKTDYKHRIIIPFYWNTRLVSFDTRDVTGRAVKRYKACPAEYEIISHKDILYGDQRQWRSVGIVVEGPPDVWRLGPAACATSGIEFTMDQVREIARAFSRVFVIYDNERQAQIQARHLIAELQARGRPAERIIVPVVADPGSMPQSEADYLIKQLLTKIY